MLLPRGMVAGLAATWLLAVSAPASALLSYHIQIDTTTLENSVGYLDFQFNPGSVPAPAATAVVFDVSGATFTDPSSDPPVVDGDVTGTLPSTLGFGNLTSFNAYLAPITFGASFQLTLNLDGDTGGSGPNTAFSLALLDIGFVPQLLADPAAGYPLLTLDRNPASGLVTVAVGAANPTGVIVTAVSEPSVLGLLIGGMGLLSLAAIRRLG